MKNKTTKTLIIFCAVIISALFLSQNSFSQPWTLGGTAGPPLTIANNFNGSDAATNIAIRMGTFGITRMFMQNNTGPTAGFIGIGDGFITPQNLLHLNQATSAPFYAQWQILQQATHPLMMVSKQASIPLQDFQ